MRCETLTSARRGILSLCWVLASTACRQIVGFDEPRSHDAAAEVQVCGLPYGTLACASCAKEGCCNESLACASEGVTCAPYEACVGACVGDPTCRAQCAVDHPPGTSAQGSALAACLATHCEAACALTCGSLFYSVPPKAAPACEACYTSMTDACTRERACASSADCDALQRCLTDCQFFLDCQEACINTHPASVSFSVFEGMSPCSSSCGFGTDWRCVGKIDPNGSKQPKSLATSLTAQVLSNSDHVTPRQGVEVAICSPKDLHCSPPVAGPGQTNAMGMVTLQVPTQSVLFGGRGLVGYVQLTSRDTVPVLWAWGFPVTEASLDLTSNALGYYAPSPATPDEATRQRTLLNIPQPVDATRGEMYVWVFDCFGFFGAPEVEVRIDNTDMAIVRTYFGGGSATISNGFVDFQNVPAGPVWLTAVPRKLGQPSSKLPLMVREGAVTISHVYPILYAQ
jgi:hypothetical protein